MNSSIQSTFDAYPTHVMDKLVELRGLIFDIAKENALGDIEESLKWGQPSYHVNGGSPIRIDWSSKRPNHVSIYFHCQTKLVDTFRELFSDALELHGNREISLQLDTPLPLNEIHQCLELALTYKSIKHLPLLGK